MTSMSLWTVRFLFIVGFKLLITVNIFHTAIKMNIEKQFMWILWPCEQCSQENMLTK